jgi:hypothetical protein
MLTEQEANRIFSWRPYRDSWPVDRNQVDDSIVSYYGDLIDSLTTHSQFDALYSEDGSLGNYLEFMCYPKGHEEYEGHAILVCISLCSPFAVYGQIKVFKTTDSFSWGHMFSPENAYNVSDSNLFDIEKIVKAIILNHNLKFLDTEFLSRQLPGEVAVSLKHENHNEGTQYLHGIFQKTD